MSDWVKRSTVSEPSTLYVQEQNGRQTPLRVVTRTEYEQNNKTGEIRPVQVAGTRTVTVYTEIPNGAKTVERRNSAGEVILVGGKDLWTEAKSFGTGYTYQDASGKRYVAQVFHTTENPQTPGLPITRGIPESTPFAGAAVRNNVANFNAGKPADFTQTSLSKANEAALTQARARAEARTNAQVPGSLGLSRSQNPPRQTSTVTDSAGGTGTDAGGGGGGGGSNQEDQGPQTSLGGSFSRDPITLTASGVKELKKDLRYPLQAIRDAVDENNRPMGQDFLRIQIREYKPAGKALIRDRSKDSLKSQISKQVASITLPIPSSIQDGNSVSYADGSLDNLTAALATYSLDFMNTTGKDKTVQEFNTELLNKMGNIGNVFTSPEMKDVFLRGLAVEAANLPGVGQITKEQLLARETGGILNPNMELLFNGVSLRSFKFSFKMTPRNKPEADEIKLIIRTLKANMAPKLASGPNVANGFLKTPCVFDLIYMQGSQPHPFLHRFKMCALTDMAVNYTGEGIYATYDDATPISMIMDLSFKELEPIYDTDYDDNDGTVGY